MNTLVSKNNLQVYNYLKKKVKVLKLMGDATGLTTFKIIIYKGPLSYYVSKISTGL